MGEVAEINRRVCWLSAVKEKEKRGMRKEKGKERKKEKKTDRSFTFSFLSLFLSLSLPAFQERGPNSIAHVQTLKCKPATTPVSANRAPRF